MAADYCKEFASYIIIGVIGAFALGTVIVPAILAIIQALLERKR